VLAKACACQKRSMAAIVVTARLRRAVGALDRATTMQCLATLVQGMAYANPDDRRDTTDACLAAAKAFRVEQVVFGALCVLVRTSALEVPVGEALTMVKPHLSSVLVVRAALRLLLLSDVEPRVAEAAVKWMRMHPQDADVSYYGAHVLLKAAGKEPEDVKLEHGAFGRIRVDCAVIEGAVATSRIEVYVRGVAWNAYVLNRLYPRLR
jgi:hypothetical protein